MGFPLRVPASLRDTAFPIPPPVPSRDDRPPRSDPMLCSAGEWLVLFRNGNLQIGLCRAASLPTRPQRPYLLCALCDSVFPKNRAPPNALKHRACDLVGPQWAGSLPTVIPDGPHFAIRKQPIRNMGAAHRWRLSALASVRTWSFGYTEVHSLGCVSN